MKLNFEVVLSNVRLRLRIPLAQPNLGANRRTSSEIFSFPSRQDSEFRLEAIPPMLDRCAHCRILGAPEKVPMAEE